MVLKGGAGIGAREYEYLSDFGLRDFCRKAARP